LVVADVSGQRVGPVFKRESSQEDELLFDCLTVEEFFFGCLTLEDGTYMLSRNVVNQQPVIQDFFLDSVILEARTDRLPPQTSVATNLR
jgi:hypothetical protein